MLKSMFLYNNDREKSMNNSINVQVLVATMHQSNHALLEQMHIETDALVGNQCDRCSNDEFEINGRKCVYFNRTDRGVGLNRNVTLYHAGDGIIAFADDDMIFVDGYEKIIKKAFLDIPDADAFVFNIHTIGKDMGRKVNKKIKRLHFYNALNYGTARLSVLANSIRRENITFHTSFGGGTKYSCGEDTLFIVDMLKHGLKIYAYPAYIASVDQTASTWFKGYNKKYLHDKGALFAAISKRWCKVLCIQDLIRHTYLYKENGISLIDAYNLMKEGIESFRQLLDYKE